jgi:hypothetical protein
MDRRSTLRPGRASRPLAPARRVARLFDGRHDDDAILERLPRRLSALFTPRFLARLAHPDNGLAAGLRENDTTCDWPATPRELSWVARVR